MAQYRQAGADRFAVRSHDFHHSNGSSAADHVSLGIRIPHKFGRSRRSNRSDKNSRILICALFVILSLVLIVSVFAFSYISRDKDLNRFRSQDDDLNSDLDFLTNVTRSKSSKVLKFGQGSVAHGRDSRYWDRDDRRRDEEYNEDTVEHTSIGANDGSTDNNMKMKERIGSDQVSLYNTPKKSNGKQRSDHKSIGLYNEAGRDELKLYEAEYEASLKNVGQSRQEYSNKHEQIDGDDLGVQNEEINSDDEYDDGIDSHDARMEDYDDIRNDSGDHSDLALSQNDNGGESSKVLVSGIRDPKSAEKAEDSDDVFSNFSKEDSLLNSQSSDNAKIDARHVNVVNGRSAKRSSSEKRSASRRKEKRRSLCDMKFLNSTAQLVEPSESRKFSRFSLQYTKVEERPSGQDHWEPRFAGHQSLQEREESFYARDNKINCGFVKGPEGSPSTGFDIAEDDARFMSSCHIAVSSCIFGNSDHLRTPTGCGSEISAVTSAFSSLQVTRFSRKNVCFVMFMDENTLQTLSSEGQKPDIFGYIGLWKIVVVKNLPYADMRRVGKIPKLLTHRLFPSARYSIWLDSKLRLQSDPHFILEYFLWRKGYEYAISNHYDRHCVWEEVAQNKKLNKFNHTVIDQQFAFYQADGLKRFNASDPNKLLPSYVPEGSFIVRAHTPMSNLFSCLWFNEVERFTPRDQLSFAYTYLKLRRTNSGKPLHLNMFKDCERRAIAKLYHHRSEEKQSIHSQAIE
ncbi:hypothetical protein HHK36_004421 [Tetracentron sinense]|uniref:TOD1/MUCI70 glycosyltransferase-like domain-containing protein n=1 Tax=Tetracentron sinense TaxID=13715 RepID=A0A835A0E4_TETSI|nr:hypothetical protein HHK36_004421 [Tetracentron sinense]